MKKLIIGLSLFVTATAANAISDNAKFVAIDNSLESNLCVTAATKGFAAAKEKAALVSKRQADLLHLTSCNGVAIEKFSLSFKTTTQAKLVKFVPADKTNESKLCAQAAKEGMTALTTEKGLSVLDIVCNGKSIVSFAKQNSGI